MKKLWIDFIYSRTQQLMRRIRAFLHMVENKISFSFHRSHRSDHPTPGRVSQGASLGAHLHHLWEYIVEHFHLRNILRVKVWVIGLA